VLAAAELYDFQAQPENVELMTFQPDGSNRRVNRGWQMPRNYEELVQRRKALQAWAALSCGFCGRSPDHLSSSLVGQRMGIEVFRKHGAARAKAVEDFFDYARHNDLYVSYVIINPQAERGKDWASRPRIWSPASSTRIPPASPFAAPRCSAPARSWANELLVANMQPLKPGEEDIAFSCALPMNAKGLRVLSRKSYEAHAVSVFDNPLFVAVRRERRADVFRRRQGAVGPRVRASRHRHVPGAIPRYAVACLSELSGADPAPR